MAFVYPCALDVTKSHNSGKNQNLSPCLSTASLPTTHQCVQFPSYTIYCLTSAFCLWHSHEHDSEWSVSFWPRYIMSSPICTAVTKCSSLEDWKTPNFPYFCKLKKNRRLKHQQVGLSGEDTVCIQSGILLPCPLEETERGEKWHNLLCKSFS